MIKIKNILLFVAFFVMCGCDDLLSPDIPTNRIKTSGDNIRYAITCVEGHKFVVTRSNHDRTHLAGPIGQCDSVNQ